MAKYPDGYTETDPRTGEVWTVNNGQWVKGAAPGGGKAPTEAQSKDLFYGSNIVDADADLVELEAQGYDPSLVKPGNAAMMEKSRMYNSAAERFANAILRKESGAAITEPEIKRVGLQYFAQVGDTPAVREQKARARREAAQNLMGGTGNLFAERRPDKVKRFQQTETIKGMSPQQIETRKKFRGSTAPVGTKDNPRVPRNKAEYASLPQGSWYIHPDGIPRMKGVRPKAKSTPANNSGTGWKIVSVE